MRQLQALLIVSFAGFLVAQVPTVPPAPPTTTTIATTTTTTVPAVTTTTLPSVIPTAPPATTTAPPPGECPPSGLHTLPTDHCQEFVTCINGNRVYNKCQDGWLFDATSLRCEPAPSVDCGTRFRP